MPAMKQENNREIITPDLFFHRTYARIQQRRAVARRGTRDQSNEKRKSTHNLYLVMVPIITKELRDLSRYISRMRALTQQWPLLCDCEAGTSLWTGRLSQPMEYESISDKSSFP